MLVNLLNTAGTDTLLRCHRRTGYAIKTEMLFVMLELFSVNKFCRFATSCMEEVGQRIRYARVFVVVIFLEVIGLGTRQL